MEKFLVDVIGLIAAGVFIALIRYYTVYYTLKMIRGRLRLHRKRKHVEEEESA